MTSGFKTATIAASGSGDNEIVAAVSGHAIEVWGFVLSPSAAVNMKWRSATTDKTGLMYHTAVSITTVVAPPGSHPYFSTAVGAALNLNLSGATATGGYVLYREV